MPARGLSGGKCRSVDWEGDQKKLREGHRKVKALLHVLKIRTISLKAVSNRSAWLDCFPPYAPTWVLEDKMNWDVKQQYYVKLIYLICHRWLGSFSSASHFFFSFFIFKVKNGSYEHPYTNPKAPVHIITGSAVSLTRVFYTGKTYLHSVNFEKKKGEVTDLQRSKFFSLISYIPLFAWSVISGPNLKKNKPKTLTMKTQ